MTRSPLTQGVSEKGAASGLEGGQTPIPDPNPELRLPKGLTPGGEPDQSAFSSPTSLLRLAFASPNSMAVLGL